MNPHSTYANLSDEERAGLDASMIARDDTTFTGHGDWFVHMICCNLDMGYQRCESWAEADAFRNTWIDSGPSRYGNGHDRSGVIEHADPLPEPPDGHIGQTLEIEL